MVERLIPKEIQTIGGELAIAWSDGAESYLALEALRRACPCAVCGGEPDVMGQVVRPTVSYTPESFVAPGVSDRGRIRIATFVERRSRIGTISVPLSAPAGRTDRMSRAAKVFLLGFLFAVCGAGVLWQYWSERQGEVTPPRSALRSGAEASDGLSFGRFRRRLSAGFLELPGEIRYPGLRGNGAHGISGPVGGDSSGVWRRPFSRPPRGDARLFFPAWRRRHPLRLYPRA